MNGNRPWSLPVTAWRLANSGKIRSPPARQEKSIRISVLFAASVCATDARQGGEPNGIRLVELTQVKCRSAIRHSGSGSCVFDWYETYLRQENDSP